MMFDAWIFVTSESFIAAEALTIAHVVTVKTHPARYKAQESPMWQAAQSVCLCLYYICMDVNA